MFIYKNKQAKHTHTDTHTGFEPKIFKMFVKALEVWLDHKTSTHNKPSFHFSANEQCQVPAVFTHYVCFFQQMGGAGIFDFNRPIYNVVLEGVAVLVYASIVGKSK